MGRRKPLTEEHKQKIRETKLRLKEERGYINSPETRKKISEANKGKPSHWKGKHLPEETRKKISESLKGRYVGEKNHNWRGGTSLDNSWRQTDEYLNWRNSVYKRDGWCCFACGKHCQSKDIAAHHIAPYSERPELKYDIDNGITLCRSCHIGIHMKRKEMINDMKELSQKNKIKYISKIFNDTFIRFKRKK